MSNEQDSGRTLPTDSTGTTPTTAPDTKPTMIAGPRAGKIDQARRWLDPATLEYVVGHRYGNTIATRVIDAALLTDEERNKEVARIAIETRDEAMRLDRANDPFDENGEASEDVDDNGPNGDFVVGTLK
jgi:hypothetical protein